MVPASFKRSPSPSATAAPAATLASPSIKLISEVVAVMIVDIERKLADIDVDVAESLQGFHIQFRNINVPALVEYTDRVSQDGS